ncbi:MAG: phosphoadenylyl-sulfate reductase [Planctomycetota bacterium]
MFHDLQPQTTHDPFASLSPEALIRWASEEFGLGLAASTSFGIQSAVTLHLIHQQVPDLPIIWVDTGYLPEETLQYARTLTRRLDLNVHDVKSPISPKEMESRFGRLWESDDVRQLDLYDHLRKVEPMQRALRELKVSGWISGLRAEQTQHRQQLPRVKRDDQRHRIYPILRWSSRDVYQYMQTHRLPQHPLFDRGFSTVGDVHSSRASLPTDAHDRATRFRGMKQECGLHL